MTAPGLALRAITVTDFVGGVANQAAGIARSADDVVSFLQGVKFVSGLIPGLSSVAAVLDVAQPWIQKIAAAAPLVHKAIDAGAPILDVLEKNGPGVLDAAKKVLAIAFNADPARPETNSTAADVTDEQAAAFVGIIFTPGRTNAEQQREWDRAQGVS